MSMTGSRAGQRGSYPELVDALTQHGAKARPDAAQFYRRVVFNVLVSNVDDHLRGRHHDQIDIKKLPLVD
jgi:serine/threonine-protein kinase HipA